MNFTPTALPFADVYSALQTGVVQASETSYEQFIVNSFYELATYSAPSLAARYRDTADRIVGSLHDAYQPQPLTAQGFLLLHSTGNHPAHDEIDVSISYADYYYLEALQRSETMK